MTISVAQQAAALAQAAALGLAVGLLYDLFRVLRVRWPCPWGAVLDLSFLDHCDRGAVRLVSAGMAGGDPAVQDLLSLWGRGALFLAHQYLDAENRLFFGRCGGPGVAYPYPPPGGGGKIAEKTKKFAKK